MKSVTMMPLVPPAINALCQAAEAGLFPQRHKVTWVKSGAAPLAPDLARHFTALTGILVCQGYGMTEASPVTHVGFLQSRPLQSRSIGHPLGANRMPRSLAAEIDPSDTPDDLTEAPSGQPGELVMRGPQFMLGYWNEPQATAASCVTDGTGRETSSPAIAKASTRVVDRRKEMIKYKGFAVAPAEVEAVLMEHPAVKECGVVGRRDDAAGEVPVAFVALRDGFRRSHKSETNSASSSPTASPTTNSHVKSTLSTRFPRLPQERSCAGN